jgi:two-component system, OmpR family, sensor histidine kinase QseC
MSGLWPFALTMASVGLAGVAVERHRRERLNRALHELRRPLQALALRRQLAADPPGDDSLDLALVALADLDQKINGGRAALARRPVSGRALVEAAVERWRGTAAAAHRSLELSWRAGRATVLADPARIAQALDNLISNAIEHGGLRVAVRASISAGGLRIEVASDPATQTVRRLLRIRDPRRGHGLTVAAKVAASHGGRFRLGIADAGAVAVLELPLAASPISQATRLGVGARPGVRGPQAERRTLAA